MKMSSAVIIGGHFLVKYKSLVWFYIYMLCFLFIFEEPDEFKNKRQTNVGFDYGPDGGNILQEPSACLPNYRGPYPCYMLEAARYDLVRLLRSKGNPTWNSIKKKCGIYSDGSRDADFIGWGDASDVFSFSGLPHDYLNEFTSISDGYQPKTPNSTRNANSSKAATSATVTNDGVRDNSFNEVVYEADTPDYYDKKKVPIATGEEKKNFEQENSETKAPTDEVGDDNDEPIVVEESFSKSSDLDTSKNEVYIVEHLDSSSDSVEIVDETRKRKLREVEDELEEGEIIDLDDEEEETREIIVSSKALEKNDNEKVVSSKALKKNDNEKVISSNALKKNDNEKVVSSQAVQKRDNEKVVNSKALNVSKETFKAFEPITNTGEKKQKKKETFKAFEFTTDNTNEKKVKKMKLTQEIFDGSSLPENDTGQLFVIDRKPSDCNGDKVENKTSMKDGTVKDMGGKDARVVKSEVIEMNSSDDDDDEPLSSSEDKPTFLEDMFDKRLQCDLCQVIIKDRDEMMNHLQQAMHFSATLVGVDKDGKPECVIKETGVRHKQAVFKDLIPICPDPNCSAIFKDIYACAAHSKRHGGKYKEGLLYAVAKLKGEELITRKYLINKCKVCPISFPTTKSLFKHVQKKKHEPYTMPEDVCTMFACSRCRHTFDSFWNCLQHLKKGSSGGGSHYADVRVLYIDLDRTVKAILPKMSVSKSTAESQLNKLTALIETAEGKEKAKIHVQIKKLKRILQRSSS